MREFTLTVEDLTVRAVLLDDAAPGAAELWWKQLPIQGRVRHFRWGGEAGYLMVPGMKHAADAVENPVSFYPRRSICVRAEHGEIVLPYGQSQARSHMLPATYATQFGQLVGGDVDAFLALIGSTLSAGGKDIRIERHAND